MKNIKKLFGFAAIGCAVLSFSRVVDSAVEGVSPREESPAIVQQMTGNITLVDVKGNVLTVEQSMPGTPPSPPGVKATKFYVDKATVISGDGGRQLKLEELAAGMQVRVNYQSEAGRFVARSIVLGEGSSFRG